jgi:hypothetical protein
VRFVRGCDLALGSDGPERAAQGQVRRVYFAAGEAGRHGGGAGRAGKKPCEAQHLGFDRALGDAPLVCAHACSNARDEAVDGATIGALLVIMGEAAL